MMLPAMPPAPTDGHFSDPLEVVKAALDRT